jgi:hypothetical protein
MVSLAPWPGRGLALGSREIDSSNLIRRFVASDVMEPEIDTTT